MSEVLVYWNILSEESKAIKAVVDLTKINVKFVPFDYRHSVAASQVMPDSQIIIRTYSDLRKLVEVRPEVNNFFGKDQKERVAVDNWLNLYENKYKPLLYLPLQQYLPLSKDPIQREKVTSRLKGMQNTLEELDNLFTSRQTVFLCTESMSIVDILMYFNICNLVYFGRTHHKYPAIVDWFNQIYDQREIKIITHQWFSLAKQISALFRKKKNRPSL